MTKAPKTFSWAEYGYKRADAPAVAGVRAPAATVQLNKWLLGAAAWVRRARRELDDRSAASVEELLPWLPYFAVDGWAQEDRRQFCCFSVNQMLEATGWGANARNRLRRTMCALTLSATDKDGAKLAKACRNLREAGVGPLLEPLKDGVQNKHGNVYAFAGIDPLPKLPAGTCVNPNMGCVNPASTPQPTHPQTAALGCAGTERTNDDSDILPAETTFDAQNSAHPQTAALGCAGAGQAAHPSIVNCHMSFVVGPGAVTDGADNDDGIIDEVDAAAFREIGSLYPRSFGTAEFEAKARAAYDALLARGCRPADVLARLRGAERRTWPLEDLEDQSLFADLFREEPAKVVRWAARMGSTTRCAPAARIAGLRAADPSPDRPSPGTLDAMYAVYDGNERELQRAYALAHLVTDNDNR